MPFSKTLLASAIHNILLNLRNNTDDPEMAAEALAQVIADNVASQLQAMFADAVIVNVPALTSPSGPVTGVITTTISITVV